MHEGQQHVWLGLSYSDTEDSFKAACFGKKKKKMSGNFANTFLCVLGYDLPKQQTISM